MEQVIKCRPAEFKADVDGRTFEGHASVFQVIDHDEDRVMPGAFKKAIDRNLPANLIKVLYQHDSYEPIGVPTHLEEDSTGLVTRAKVSDTSRGRDTLILMRDRVIDRLSIGFPRSSVVSRDNREDKCREILELDLRDISPVTFASNEAAMIQAVKSLRAPEWRSWWTDDLAQWLATTLAQKSVVPFQDLPLAPRDREWDAAAAEKRVREWADAGAGPNAKYRRAFLWYDAANPDQFGAFKLGIGDIVDGALKAVPRAVFAVAGVLQGARGGVDVPDSDKAAIRRQVDRYYGKMSEEFGDETIQPPWKSAILGLVSPADMAALLQAKSLIDGVMEAWNIEGLARRGDETLAGVYLAQGISDSLAKLNKLAH